MRREEREAGSTTAEVAVVVPVFMVLILVAIQLALWAHASHVVEAAATSGDAAARAYPGNATAGISAADTLLLRDGRRVVVDPQVTASVTPYGAQVTVTGQAVSILPFLSLPVSATSIAPVEMFRPEQ